MPQLPTAQDLGRLPDVNIQTRNIARADASAIGYGVERLGKGISDMGTALSDVAGKQDAYQAETGFIQFQQNQLKALDDARQNAQPGAPDFTPNFASSYQEQAKQFFATVPPSQRPQMDMRLASLEGQLTSHATTFQQAEQGRFANAQLGQSQSTLLGNIQADPNNFDRSLQQGQTLIQTIPGLTPIERQQRLDAWNNAAALEKANAAIVRNPGMFLPKVPEPQAVGQGHPGGIGDAGTPTLASPAESGSGQTAINTNTQYSEAEAKAGLPAGYVARLFHIESGGNPNNVTGSNKGLAQFADADMAKYGLNDAFDPQQALQATLQEGQQNKSALTQALGREPTAGELYLAHQQGLAGATALLKNPDQPAWEAIRSFYGSDAVAQKAISGNVPGGRGDPNMTAGQFANMWVNKFERGSSDTSSPSTADSDRIPEVFRADPAYRFLRPDQIEGVMRAAQIHQTALDRQQLDQQRTEVANVKGLMKDDVASILNTGKPVDAVNEGRVAQAMGPDAAREFLQNRANATNYYNNTNDWQSLPADEINRRIAPDGPLAPKPGEAGYDAKLGYYGMAIKQADALLKARSADPANAVDGLPGVSDAKGNASLGQPETYLPLVKARIAAQTKIGIPEPLQSPITVAEAQALMKPVQEALPGQERAALQSVMQTVKTAYGDHADRAVEFMLKQAKVDAETRQQAASLFKKLGLGQKIAPEEAQAFDEAQKNDAAAKATAPFHAQQTPQEAGPEDPLESWVKSQGQPAKPAMPVPDGDAIQMLRANPSPPMIQHFDAVYGDGAAKTVLGINPAVNR